MNEQIPGVSLVNRRVYIRYFVYEDDHPGYTTEEIEQIRCVWDLLEQNRSAARLFERYDRVVIGFNLIDYITINKQYFETFEEFEKHLQDY